MRTAMSRLLVVTDDLDVVAVGVEDERAVVAGVVDRPLTRCAVVAVARAGGRGVEPVNRRVVAGERDMDVLGRPGAREHGERSGLAGEPRPRGRVEAQLEPGMRCDPRVEGPRRGDVRDPDPEVVDDAAGAQGVVMDGLGAVAVWVEQKAAVVVVAVLRARPGRAVVPVAGLRP